MGAPRKERLRARGAALGGTVDYVLRNAPCRVMVVASRKAVGVSVHRGAIVALRRGVRRRSARR